MGWFSKIENPLVRDLSIACWRLFSDLDLSEARKTEFKSLHDCFTRELRPGLRPADPDPAVVASPCDGIIGAFGRIADTELFQIKGAPYSLLDLLGDPALVERHRNGRFITLRLTSSMYHRFHAPYDGTIERVTFIHGDVWNVNPIALKRVERLFCKNERAVMQTRLASGEALTLVPVAAILVASIRLHFLDRDPQCAEPGTDGVSLRRQRDARATNSAGSSTARPSSCWRRRISSSPTMSWKARASAPARRCCGSPRRERAVLARLLLQRQLGKAGIVGIDEVREAAHLADAKPFQFGVFVADVGGLAAFPGGDGVDVMARIAIDFRLPLSHRGDQPEKGRRHAGLFLNLADQGLIEALAILHMPADRIPMAGPHFFRWRTQAEQNCAIGSDEQCADGFGGLISHGGVFLVIGAPMI